MSAAHIEVGRLRLLHRFHVRTTLAFGGLALVLLGTTAIVSYLWARDAETAALQARLRALAVALGEGVDAETVDACLAEGRRGSPSHRALVDRFARVAEDERDVSSIYVVVRSDRREWVRFAADWVREGEPAEVGQPYDASRVPEMLAAFQSPQVEDEIKTDEWGPSMSGYAAVRDRDGRAVGVVGVDVAAQRVEGIRDQALAVTALVFGLAILALVVIGVVLGKNVQGPIERIVEASGAIAARDLSVRLRLDREDELGILARHFDRMADGLEEREHIREMFGRYVSEDVARRVLSSPGADRLGGELRDVTVLFVHVQRFAAISEGLEPARVVEMLEQYLSAMVEVIEAHGGCVIELLGDAILAVFGAPGELPDHPAAAVECGRAMEARFATLEESWIEGELAARWRSRGIDRLRLRIGIHTGPVVAGNTGGRTRMKYAVIGDAVNVAARIEALNERLETTMLVSAAVQERLPSELASRGEPRGSHAVKGREQTVDVFSYRARSVS